MRSSTLLFVVPLALLAGACGSSGSSSSTTTTTTAPSGINRLTTQRVPGIGAALTSGTGKTLYVYLPEKGGKVKCVGGCASLWPPLVQASSGKPAITSAVHPNLVATVANPSGGTIITYAGWPLHTYTADASHGTYRGQGSGGQWYMISPSGNVIMKPVNTGSSTGGGSVGGY